MNGDNMLPENRTDEERIAELVHFASLIRQQHTSGDYIVINAAMWLTRCQHGLLGYLRGLWYCGITTDRGTTPAGISYDDFRRMVEICGISWKDFCRLP
jgi:hypothetical protein